jgi:hypothetical protein
MFVFTAIVFAVPLVLLFSYVSVQFTAAAEVVNDAAVLYALVPEEHVALIWKLYVEDAVRPVNALLFVVDVTVVQVVAELNLY